MNIAPTLPLTANSAAFKGEKPESILFPGGREVKTPTWKTAVLAIMQDCNEDPVMHAHLMGLRGKVLGRQRTILAASPEKMHAPLEIDKDLYMESYYDTATLLYVLKTGCWTRSATTIPAFASGSDRSRRRKKCRSRHPAWMK